MVWVTDRVIKFFMSNPFDIAYIGRRRRVYAKPKPNTKLPSNLRRTCTRECAYVVRCCHFRSRDEDGGYAIRSAKVETPCCHSSIFYNIADRSFTFLHCGDSDFRLFCICDLDLDPMTFTYELDPYSFKMYRMTENELSNVKAFESYRAYIYTRPKTSPKQNPLQHVVFDADGVRSMIFRTRWRRILQGEG